MYSLQEIISVLVRLIYLIPYFLYLCIESKKLLAFFSIRSNLNDIIDWDFSNTIIVGQP